MIATNDNGTRAEYDQSSVEVRGNEIRIELPDGSVHMVGGYRPGACSTERTELADALSFLGAAAEAIEYRERRGKDPFAVDEDGDPLDPDGNQWLFPEAVGRWACSVSDEIACDQMALEEGE